MVIVRFPAQVLPLLDDRLPDEFMTLQELVDRVFGAGIQLGHEVTDRSTGGPLLARAAFMTDYRRRLGVNDVGSSGTVSTLVYGRNERGGAAGGYANASVIGAAVRGSDDPANEIGGCIGSLQLGVDGDDRPVYATLWGSSYTLRGYPGVQPGGLMAYTAVVQNYFDGSGSRSANYGYAAVTRPGIGDGGDFWNEPGTGFRYASTHPVDVGFVVCGDSGPYPEGGGIGYQVAFQAGGEASPWAERGDWRTRIGVGVVVQDWLEGGVHVHEPHPDAEAGAPHLRLDATRPDRASFFECRIKDEAEPVMAVRGDGRVRSAPAREPDDVVTLAQMEALLPNAATADAWRQVGTDHTPWEHGWTSAATAVSRFYRHAGRGHLELDAIGGQPGSVAFRLPVELRPDDAVSTVGAARGDEEFDLRSALVRVAADGAVSIGYPAGYDRIVASVSWRLATV